MTRHTFAFFILLGISFNLEAQTIKTGVLVVGNTSGSISAAIQSARSGAKTILLTQSPAISTGFSEEDLPYLEKIKNYYTSKVKKKSASRDSILAPLNLKEAPQLVKSMTDTVKNLTVTLNNAINKIEKDGKGWEVRLKGGQKIKADVVVDATQNLSVASLLKIDITKTMVSPGTSSNPFENKLYRSAVALGYSEPTNDARSVFIIPLGALIPATEENLVLVPAKVGLVKTLGMSVGQAAGTIASYCAFFKTTTKNINVRVVQGELLAFHARLIPFSDIQFNDPNALAFQRVGLSGLLRSAVVKEGSLNTIRFDTAGTISPEELRAPMREFYSRSQIWFADNKKQIMTIEDAISLFKFTAARGEELEIEIKNGWKESFKFSSEFDPKRPITRKEFAVLADRYLQPYNVRVDLAGNLLS